MKQIGRLLLVDDEELTRGLIALQLRRLGYQVTEVEGGQQMLHILERDSFDLILLDLDMPHMNGIEVLAQVRTGFGPLKLPVIIVTADHQEQSVVGALESGANDYLVKPLNINIADARIRTQLRLSELLRLKEDFLAFASHDLKKPILLLEDILGCMLNDMNADKTINPSLLDCAQLASGTIASMQAVVRGFLDQARQGTTSLSLAPVDISRIVGQSVERNLGYAASKNIKLEYQPPPAAELVATDVFRLTQILENLIGNSIKFCGPGATTTVSIGKNGDCMVIAISDQGPGFTLEELPRLFTKGAGIGNRPTGGEESTGIGLVLCHELAEQIHASLTVANNPDRGATFELILPLQWRKEG
ncbi:MAG: HAMP domain-containing histidine kinase [Gammaproteobacteria bacterium]|nr:HAMP domain-containing histidine kinase [Gammaproteobacteria bacterium]